MKETLSTSEKEVPKTRLALQEKYDQEKKEEPHAKRLDENNIPPLVFSFGVKGKTKSL